MQIEKLKQQLAETGDLMDVMNDASWLRETAEIEAESDGAVEAGLGLRDYVAQTQTLSASQRRQVQLQSILLSELHRWMMTWELGHHFDAAYTQARQQLRHHLSQPTATEQDWFDALLNEAESTSDPSAQTLRAQVASKLSTLLNPEDWDAIAAAASTSVQVLRKKTSERQTAR